MITVAIVAAVLALACLFFEKGAVALWLGLASLGSLAMRLLP